MADRYWVGDGGNWSDNTNHWSAADGGAPNASLPTSSDNVYFTANSFSGGGLTVTVDATANCLDMVWTGAMNTPRLAGGHQLQIYGSVTFITDMTYSQSGVFGLYGGAAARTLRTNGLDLSSIGYIEMNCSGDITLQDAINIGTKTYYFKGGTLITGNNNMTIGSMNISAAAVRTLTLGASTIACTSWDYSGSNLTVTANTATINVSGTGAVTLGNADYNGADFNLNGTAHTVSGSPTGIAIFKLKSDATQTITFTDGDTLTADTPTLSGSSGHVHTLTGSGTAGWNIVSSSQNPIQVYYCTIDYSTASGAVFYALAHDNNVDGGNNSGWKFTTDGAVKIHHFVPPHIKRDFYHGVGGHKGTRHNGKDPYGWTTDGLVLYAPLWALKDSAFKSVDAYKHTCTKTGVVCGTQGGTFDGDDDNILIGNAGIDLSNNFTLMFWLKPTDTGVLHYVIGVASYGADDLFLRQGTDDKLVFDTYSGTGTDTVTAAALTQNAWVHVALVVTAGVSQFYINGAASGDTKADHTANWNQNWYIGGGHGDLHPPTENEWEGIIGEGLIHNRALAVGELQNHRSCTIWRYQ